MKVYRKLCVYSSFCSFVHPKFCRFFFYDAVALYESFCLSTAKIPFLFRFFPFFMWLDTQSHFQFCMCSTFFSIVYLLKNDFCLSFNQKACTFFHIKKYQGQFKENLKKKNCIKFIFTVHRTPVHRKHYSLSLIQMQFGFFIL